MCSISQYFQCDESSDQLNTNGVVSSKDHTNIVLYQHCRTTEPQKIKKLKLSTNSYDVCKYIPIDRASRLKRSESPSLRREPRIPKETVVFPTHFQYYVTTHKTVSLLLNKNICGNFRSPSLWSVTQNFACYYWCCNQSPCSCVHQTVLAHPRI